MELDLSWVGPLHLAGTESSNLFLNPVALEPGVYIWTARVGDENRAYYVGESGKSFGERHAQHLAAYLQGQYRIYDAVSFVKGVKRAVWEGSFGPRNRQKLAVFRERMGELGPALQSFLSVLNFILIPLRGGRRTRERLEAALAGIVRDQSGPAGTFQDEDIQYRPCRPGEDPLTFTFSPPLPVSGLSDLSILLLPRQQGTR